MADGWPTRLRSRLMAYYAYRKAGCQHTIKQELKSILIFKNYVIIDINPNTERI